MIPPTTTVCNTTTAYSGAAYRFSDSKILYIAEKNVLRAIPDMGTFEALQLDLDGIVFIPQSSKDLYVIGLPYPSTDLMDELGNHHPLKAKQLHKPQKSSVPNKVVVLDSHRDLP
jgi:hypothetical protein